MGAERLSIGVELGSKSLRVAGVRLQEGGEWEVDFSQEIPLPESALGSEEEGVNLADLQDVLRTQLRGKKLRSARLTLSPPDSDVIMRLFSTSPDNQENLNKAILEEIRAYALFQKKEPHLVFHQFPAGAEGEVSSASLRIIFSACPREWVEGMADICEEMNLDLIAIYPSAVGILNYSRALNLSDTALLVDIGKKKTNLFFVSGGIILFMRIIDFGEEELLKRYAVNTLNFSSDAQLPKEAVELRDSFLIEIKSSLSYYASKFASTPPVKCVYLFEELGRLQGLGDFFSGKLFLPVQEMHKISAGKEIPPGFETAIGLALEGEEWVKDLNLLPARYHQKKKVAGLVYTALIPLFLFLFLTVAIQKGITALSLYKGKTITNLETRLDQDKQNVEQAQGELQALNSRVGALMNNQGTRVKSLSISAISWTSSLMKIDRQLPSGIWVASLSMEEEQDGLKGSLEGYALSPLQLTRLLSSLNQALGFKNVQLSDSSSATYQGKDVIHYKIEFHVDKEDNR